MKKKIMDLEHCTSFCSLKWDEHRMSSSKWIFFFYFAKHTLGIALFSFFFLLFLVNDNYLVLYSNYVVSVIGQRLGVLSQFWVLWLQSYESVLLFSICAGLSFRSTEESLRKAFKNFGQLLEGGTELWILDCHQCWSTFIHEFSFRFLTHRLHPLCSEPRHG